jgi:hypothetical protein
MLGIAFLYGISLADLKAANPGVNPNFLSIGSQLIIPISGEIAEIATGAILPTGADAVVMLEYARKIDEGQVEILVPATPGENVSKAGEDVLSCNNLRWKKRTVRRHLKDIDELVHLLDDLGPLVRVDGPVLHRVEPVELRVRPGQLVVVLDLVGGEAVLDFDA